MDLYNTVHNLMLLRILRKGSTHTCSQFVKPAVESLFGTCTSSKAQVITFKGAQLQDQVGHEDWQMCHDFR